MTASHRVEIGFRECSEDPIAANLPGIQCAIAMQRNNAADRILLTVYA
jgi:hypothetical protein